MRPSSPAIGGLDRVRGVTLRHLRPLSQDAIDWLPLPDAKSIAELALHIAGFEYLAVAAVRRAQHLTWRSDVWPGLAGGFAREAGFEPVCGLSCRSLVERLDQVRVLTLEHLAEPSAAAWVDDLAGAARGLLAELSTYGPPADYAKLTEGHARSLVAEGPTDAAGRTDLIALLTHHETYHRGHVTYVAYLHSRRVTSCE
jgi:hypothetical protein